MTTASHHRARPRVARRHRSGSGAWKALRGVSIAAGPRRGPCLLGDNGAGKSTLIKVMSGVHQQTTGDLLIDGEPDAVREPARRDGAGIATVFQDLAMVAADEHHAQLLPRARAASGWGPLKRYRREEGERGRPRARSSRPA